jgi:septal ring factor EnvC (AmiA/AmiB activator)
MRQRTALWITAALTAFVLGAGSLLALAFVRLQGSPAPSGTAVVSSSDSVTVDTLLAREAEYQARLREANQRIQQANAAIASLQQAHAALVTQNQTLLAREAAYRRAIEQANALLQQQPAQQIAPSYGQPDSNDDGHFNPYDQEQDDD